MVLQDIGANSIIHLHFLRPRQRVAKRRVREEEAFVCNHTPRRRRCYHSPHLQIPQALVDFQVRQHIVVHWISQMVQQVLERAHAREDGLDEVAQHRHHSQAPVLNFLQLQLL